MRWLLLLVGLALTLMCLGYLWALYAFMRPYGGIPLSWDLLRINAWHFAALMLALFAGLTFLAFAARSFLRSRHKRSLSVTDIF